MRVEIKKDIFDGKDFKGLNYLIQITSYEGRYEIFVDIPKIFKCDLYKRIDDEDKELLNEAFDKAITDNKNSDIIISFKKNDVYFNIQEAIRFLIQPVSIVLENSLNDSFFIKAISQHFDSSGTIQRHIDNGWIQFENAGGCTNVENFMKGKLQSFNNLPKNNLSYLRSLVVLDSDKDYSTAPQKKTYTDLIIFLGTKSVHILSKRAMENYMPEDVFSYLSDKRLKAWVDVYMHLNQSQKDYLNIYDGFPKKNPDGSTRTRRNELSTGILDLFRDVSDVNFSILDGGFKLADFKTVFPQFFLSRHTYKHNMTHRANSNELLEIINKIKELL